jgi:DNA-binding GntR family transcriptional regulator
VYLSLRKSILKGEYAPGYRLIVLDIANRFGISQAPVREALERLKQERLIIGKLNKGSIVSDITTKEIRDIFVMREVIELFAVKECLPFLDDCDFQTLASYLDDMRASVENQDSYGIVEADMNFHGFFYRRCNNHVVWEMWKGMRTKIMRFISITNEHFTGENIIDSHVELLNSFKKGNLEDIESLLQKNMRFHRNFT